MISTRQKIALAALAALLLVLLPSAPARAADEVQGYGDPGALIMSEEGPDRCPRKQRPAGKLAYSVAVDRAWARARKWGAKSGYKRFRASADWKSARRARGAAVVALAGAERGAAVTALLRAAALEPRNARYVLDAGVLLSQVGLVREAAAFVDQAGRLKAPRTTPMGISFRSQVENARGFVLLLAGDFKSADKVLAGVEKRTPLLAEARINRWAAQACRTGKPRPRPDRRRDLKGPRLDLSGGSSAPPAAEFKAWPSSPQHAWALADWADARTEQIRAELAALGDAHTQKWDAALEAWAAALKGQPGQWLTTRRVDGLTAALRATDGCEVSRLGEFAGVPEIAAVVALCERAEKAEWDASEGYQLPFERRPPPKEPESGYSCEEDYAWAGQNLPTWRGKLQDAITAQREWYEAWHRVHTAITEQMPTALGARSNLTTQTQPLYFELLWIGAMRSDAPKHPGCADDPEPQNGMPSASAGPGGPGCSGSVLGMLGLQFEFGRMKVSLNCERAALEVSTPGWASAFTEVSYAWGSGQTTVFTGGQVSQEMGPFGASARGGVSVTIDANGNIVDAGVRGEASLGGSMDELTIDGWSAGAEYHLSPAY